MKKKGKGGKEKGEKLLKNASLKVKNLKLFAGPVEMIKMYNIYP